MAEFGRKTKYRDTYPVKLNEYLDGLLSDDIPFVEDLEIMFDVDDSTLINWAKKHEAFASAYRRLKAIQRKKLKEKGLTGEYKGNVAIFLLSADHNLKAQSNNTNVNINSEIEKDDTESREIIKNFIEGLAGPKGTS